MKKILFLAVVALGVLAASCSKNVQESTSKEDVIESPVAGSDGIVVLTDGDYYQPGKPVDRLTIIDFNAKWCGPCGAFKPAFDEAAKEFAGQATFVSVDIDNVPNMMSEFNLEPAIPTVLFIHPDGSFVSYLGTDDLLPYEKFAELIKNNL